MREMRSKYSHTQGSDSLKATWIISAISNFDYTGPHVRNQPLLNLGWTCQPIVPAPEEINVCVDVTVVVGWSCYLKKKSIEDMIQVLVYLSVASQVLRRGDVVVVDGIAKGVLKIIKYKKFLKL